MYNCTDWKKSFKNFYFVRLSYDKKIKLEWKKQNLTLLKYHSLIDFCWHFKKKNLYSFFLLYNASRQFCPCQTLFVIRATETIIIHLSQLQFRNLNTNFLLKSSLTFFTHKWFYFYNKGKRLFYIFLQTKLNFYFSIKTFLRKERKRLICCWHFLP